MLVTYSIGTYGWAGIWTLIGGGNGWTAMPHDFRGYNKIKFALKARSAAERPTDVKVEIQYTGGAITPRATIPTDDLNWKNLEVSFASLTDAQKQTIKQINFVFDTGTRNGAIYIDDVRFTQT